LAPAFRAVQIYDAAVALLEGHFGGTEEMAAEATEANAGGGGGGGGEGALAPAVGAGGATYAFGQQHAGRPAGQDGGGLGPFAF
jgi:uncharacterized protein HemX